MVKAALSISSHPEGNSELKCMRLCMQSLPGYELYLHFVGLYSVPDIYLASIYYFLFCHACTLNWVTALVESI